MGILRAKMVDVLAVTSSIEREYSSAFLLLVTLVT